MNKKGTFSALFFSLLIASVVAGCAYDRSRSVSMVGEAPQQTERRLSPRRERERAAAREEARDDTLSGEREMIPAPMSPSPSAREMTAPIPKEPNPSAPTPRAPSNAPFATPVPGKPGYVYSPFAPQSGYVDVNGMPSGSEAKDPYTGKVFRVP